MINASNSTVQTRADIKQHPLFQLDMAELFIDETNPLQLVACIEVLISNNHDTNDTSLQAAYNTEFCDYDLEALIKIRKIFKFLKVDVSILILEEMIKTKITSANMIDVLKISKLDPSEPLTQYCVEYVQNLETENAMLRAGQVRQGQDENLNEEDDRESEVHNEGLSLNPNSEMGEDEEIQQVMNIAIDDNSVEENSDENAEDDDVEQEASEEDDDPDLIIPANNIPENSPSGIRELTVTPPANNQINGLVSAEKTPERRRSPRLVELERQQSQQPPEKRLRPDGRSEIGQVTAAVPGGRGGARGGGTRRGGR